MKKRIREALVQINKEKGWPTDTKSLIKTLIDHCKVIYTEPCGEHRWWSELHRVAEVAPGLFVQYDWAVANRDESIYELGWEFFPESICEVTPVQVTVLRYEEVKEDD